MTEKSKNDVFVGNLTFNTTEDHLREKFSFIGPVKSIRILADKETGKPKGFAFVEYFDTNAALSAIRHLDLTELNGRKIKVGYPAQSNLKDIARQIGHVVPESSADSSGSSSLSRSQIEQNIISSMRLHEIWDLIDAMKKLVTEDNTRGLFRYRQKVRSILETHPQLILAMYEMQKRLGLSLPASVQQQQQQDADKAMRVHSTSQQQQQQQQQQSQPQAPPPQQQQREQRDSSFDDRADGRAEGRYSSQSQAGYQHPPQLHHHGSGPGQGQGQGQGQYRQRQYPSQQYQQQQQQMMGKDFPRDVRDSRDIRERGDNLKRPLRPTASSFMGAPPADSPQFAPPYPPEGSGHFPVYAGQREDYDYPGHHHSQQGQSDYDSGGGNTYYSTNASSEQAESDPYYQSGYNHSQMDIQPMRRTRFN